MKLDNTIKNIKDLHPETVILLEIGAFYHAYGKDAYILSYLFGYQIKSIENTYNTCGAPKSAINKILSKLEEYKINYITIIRSQNYEVDQEIKYKDKNNYNEIYEKAYKYTSLKNRINGIYNYLMENIDSPNIKSKIQMVEESLFEAGKA